MEKIDFKLGVRERGRELWMMKEEMQRQNYQLFIISVVHEVQKGQKERQKDRTDRTSASTQITDKNMHVTDSKNIR